MLIEQVIQKVVTLLGDAEYVLIGSCNLFLQGVAVNPRDVDILTTSEGIRLIDSKLDAYRTKEVYFDTSDGRNSFRSFYEIDGVEVEVLGNVGNAYRSTDFLTHRVEVELGGVRVPCLDLHQELDAYRKMGRAGRVEMLESFLKATNR